MRITAVVNLDNTPKLCKGEIIIHWIEEPQAYITWKILDGEKLIASKSENYLFKENVDSTISLLQRIIKRIESFRIGRNRIISNVKLVGP